MELIELINSTHPMNCSHRMSVKELIDDLDFYILAGNAQKRALKGLDYKSRTKQGAQAPCLLNSDIYL